MTFEQRPERGQEVSHIGIPRKSTPSREENTLRWENTSVFKKFEEAKLAEAE